MTNKIYPCLWFNGQAKDAATFYCSVFPDSKITDENPSVVMMELNGKPFMCLNAASALEFNDAVSFVVNCETQDEIDYYWEKLTSDGGSENRCGWLKDKFGVSWQVVPSILPELMRRPNKADKIVAAFMKMKKFDIATLVNV